MRYKSDEFVETIYLYDVSMNDHEFVAEGFSTNPLSFYFHCCQFLVL